MRGQRGTLRLGRWPGYVDVTKVIFSFRKSVFRDVRTDYNLDLRFLSEKANFNGGFVVRTRHISIFPEDARGLCSQGPQRTNES